MSFLLTGIIIILIIIAVVAAVVALILRRDLVLCETTESQYCPAFICPDGKPAQRVGSNGKTEFSS